MHGDSQRACLRTGNGFAQHRESRGTRATDALGQTLQSAGEGQHRGHHFGAAKYGGLGSDQEIARQRELEAAGEGEPAHDSDRRHAQGFGRRWIRLFDALVNPVQGVETLMSRSESRRVVRFASDDLDVAR
jgi:hypothetical protein